MQQRHHLGAVLGEPPPDGADQYVEPALLPDRDAAARQGARRRRRRSRSLTLLTSSGSAWRGITRLSSFKVDAPKMPSAGSPTLRWSSPRAEEVSSPKIPSTLPVSKPRADKRLWRSATSSPLRHRVPQVEEPIA